VSLPARRGKRRAPAFPARGISRLRSLKRAAKREGRRIRRGQAILRAAPRGRRISSPICQGRRLRRSRRQDNPPEAVLTALGDGRLQAGRKRRLNGGRVARVTSLASRRAVARSVASCRRPCRPYGAGARDFLLKERRLAAADSFCRARSACLRGAQASPRFGRFRSQQPVRRRLRRQPPKLGGSAASHPSSAAPAPATRTRRSRRQLPVLRRLRGKFQTAGQGPAGRREFFSPGRGEFVACGPGRVSAYANPSNGWPSASF
jgi:hypothetical protein